jgi:hypothetical protein
MRLNNELEWSILLLKLLLFLTCPLPIRPHQLWYPFFEFRRNSLQTENSESLRAQVCMYEPVLGPPALIRGTLLPVLFCVSNLFFLCVLSSHSYDRLLFISASSLSVFFLSSVFCWQFLFPSLRGSERGFFLSRSPIRDASSTNCRYICRCWFKVDRLILPG